MSNTVFEEEKNYFLFCFFVKDLKKRVQYHWGVKKILNLTDIMHIAKDEFRNVSLQCFFPYIEGKRINFSSVPESTLVSNLE